MMKLDERHQCLIDGYVESGFGDIMFEYLIFEVRYVNENDLRFYAVMEETRGKVSELICLFPPLHV